MSQIILNMVLKFSDRIMKILFYLKLDIGRNQNLNCLSQMSLFIHLNKFENELLLYGPNIFCTTQFCYSRLDVCDQFWCSVECNIYDRKFGSANDIDGSGASKIAFSGEATFIGNTSDVEVKLRYSDRENFNDPQHWGLVQEDGKTSETSCLDLKLYKFLSNDYQNGTQVTDLTITASNNTQKQWRYYSFTIKGGDLASRLVQTSNSNNYVYKGYYGIAFYATEVDVLQYTFYFDFTIIVDKVTGAAIDTAFRPFSLTASAGCIPVGSCTITSQTKLNWCQDFNCTKYIEKRDLHLNDQFVLQQIITTPGMSGFYLTNTEVWYIGQGLQKKAKIEQIDNSVVGSVRILLTAEVIWKNVIIQVNSVLSNNINGTRRLLTQTTFDTVSGQTEELTCIKDEDSDTCPDCNQQCKINGYANEGCEVCTFANIITFIYLSYFLVILS